MTTDCPHPRPSRIRRPHSVAAACALGLVLSGCANVADSMFSSAFVDPAKYDLYNCVQLRKVRTESNTRVTELQKLRAKAETGAAGSVVADVAYGNDLLSAQAQARLADQVWQRNNCDSAPMPVEKPVPAVAAKDQPEPTKPR